MGSKLVWKTTILPCIIVDKLEYEEKKMILWDGENTIPMPGYSIVEGLLINAVANTPESQLLPFEKLYIALNSNHSLSAVHLTPVYVACGCFEKAKELFAAADHQRKLGDICWIQGDYEEAEKHYLNPKSRAQPYRTEPDHDRLIKLAFFREQWDMVVSRFELASFSLGFNEGGVCCGRTEMRARPFLEMLAIALRIQNKETPAEALSLITSAFEFSLREWEKFLAEPSLGQPATIQKLKERCPPRIGKNPPLSVETALARGCTKRAKDVLAYILQSDEWVNKAQEYLTRYGDTGEEATLHDFVETVTRSGVTSISDSFLFSAMGHGSFNPPKAPPERMVRLYAAHPIMNKRHFGKLLQLKFEHHIPLTGRDLLTGLFQQMGSLTDIFEPELVQDFFDYKRLAYCQDWAELCLTDWLSKQGATIVANVARVWREGKSKPVRHPFGGETKKPPETPRNMIEWMQMLNMAAKWLHAKWKKEMDSTISAPEDQLYQLLKQPLNEWIIQQYVRPTWLLPQHLDIFIPEISIAVEYMGQQHYEPIDFFGGATAFDELQKKDRKKQALCTKYQIDLLLVRYDENIERRAKEIVEYVRMKENIKVS